MQIVEIQWKDTTSCHEMMSFEDAVEHNPLTITQVGFLVLETNDVLILASEKVENGRFVRDITVIPRGNVTLISKLG